MKTGIRLSLTLLLAAGAAACGGGNNNNPVPPQPLLNTNQVCNPAIPGSMAQPQCNSALNNPLNTLQGLPNTQTSDIGVLQAGGKTVIRNRQFTMSRGYGIESTDDQCTVDKLGDHVARPVKRPLSPGADYMTFSFDALGNLTIDMRTGVGEVRTPGPVVPCGQGTTTVQNPVQPGQSLQLIANQACYQIDGQGLSFPNGFALYGQPSGSYVGMETRLCFGMLKTSDAKIREDNDIPLNSDPFSPLASWSVPTFSSVATYNPNFNLNGGVNGNTQVVNGQSVNGVQPLGGLGLTGQSVNELSMVFAQGTTAQIVPYPINPQHVLEIYFQVLSYESNANVAVQTPMGATMSPAHATGRLIYTEFR